MSGGGYYRSHSAYLRGRIAGLSAMIAKAKAGSPNDLQLRGLLSAARRDLEFGDVLREGEGGEAEGGGDGGPAPAEASEGDGEGDTAAERSEGDTGEAEGGDGGPVAAAAAAGFLF